MSLWGNSEVVTQSNTAAASITIAAANSTVTGTNTKFADDFVVGLFINVGDNDYVITNIANNDTMTVSSGKADGIVIGASANTDYIVSTKPKSVRFAESLSAVSGDVGLVYGVSADEMAYANTADTERDAIAHAGWVRRVEGTGGRSGRVFYEVLVAGSSITGDAADDSVLPEEN